MTSAHKPVFMRPVEITSAIASIDIRDDDGGEAWTTITIDTGVYSSMQAVLYAFECRAKDDIATMTTNIAFVDDGNGEIVVKFTFTGTTLGGGIKIDSATIGNFWGEAAGTYTGLSSKTFQWRPQYIWLPGYQVAVQTRFHKVQKELAAGKTAKTGQVASITTGPDIYYRDLEFHNEKAINLFDEAATATSAPDYTKLNLDYFAQYARVSQPSSSGYPCTRGFWFWPDWNDAIDNPSTMPGGASGTGSTREGINFDLSSTADLFAFCQFDEDGFSPPAAVDVPTGREYHIARFTIHTISETPTWQAPDQGL